MNYNSIFLFFFLMTGAGIASANGTDSVNLEMPPSSLEQWYKPVSKRHVWLHTMFALRREMQAIGEYAEQGGWAKMDKWISRLEKDYGKIAEMVPEWEDEIKLRLLPELKMFAEKKDAYRTAKTLKMIQRTCDDCHHSYQPIVTAIYRSPHYGDIKVKNLNGDEQSYEDSMEALSTSVNQILIALDDGYKSKALAARQNLTDQLQNLGGSCRHCHEKERYPHERILGKATKQKLDALESRISEGRVKESQQLTGEIAVSVCARCHNIHRIVNDLRNALVPDR
jgi:cytochrome c553